MADHHKGYAVPIGGVVAYRDAISPSGVGYHIALCTERAALWAAWKQREKSTVEPVKSSVPEKFPRK